MYGARRRGSENLMEKIEERVATKLPILPFDAKAIRRGSGDLERQRTLIGGADVRIAAITLVRRLIVVTGTSDTSREFPS